MQVRHFFVVPFLLLPILLVAQQLDTDPSGRRIVTWPDGSWRFVDPDSPDDQQLLAKEEQRQRKLAREAVFTRARDSLLTAVEREKAALLQKVLIEERIRELKRSDDKQAQSRIDALQSDLELALQLLDQKTKEKKKWEDLQEDARKLSVATDAEAPQWEARLAGTGLLGTDQSLPDDWATTGQPIPEPIPWNPLLDLGANPPEEPCITRRGAVDELTGRQPLQTEPCPLFGYTSERLRPLMGTDDFVSGTGSVVRVDDNNWVFALEITIASQFAQKEFGMLEKGSLLMLYMISGYRIPLYCASTSTGQLNPVARSVTYSGRYPIDKKSLKTLRTMELDKLRIVWSTGYEDYEIHDLDFFSRQIRCLEQ